MRFGQHKNFSETWGLTTCGADVMKPTQNDVDVALKAAAKSTEEVKIFVTAFVKTKKRGKGVRVD